MSRASRLLELMECLRRYKHPVSGQKLAEELGVSLRTLYRDIAALQAQGAHIEGEAGLGYVLRPGFTLPPLMFSEEEIEAIALGTRWVVDRADEGLRKAAQNALAKISAVLTPELRRQLDGSTLLLGPAWSEEEHPALPDMLLVRKAIRQGLKLEISYKNVKGECSTRIIWPFALSFFDHVQYIEAWCEMRGDFRVFRADRIEALLNIKSHYPRSRHDLYADWRKRMGMDDPESPIIKMDATCSIPMEDYPADKN